MNIHRGIRIDIWWGNLVFGAGCIAAAVFFTAGAATEGKWWQYLFALVFSIFALVWLKNAVRRKTKDFLTKDDARRWAEDRDDE